MVPGKFIHWELGSQCGSAEGQNFPGEWMHPSVNYACIYGWMNDSMDRWAMVKVANLLSFIMQDTAPHQELWAEYPSCLYVLSTLKYFVTAAENGPRQPMSMSPLWLLKYTPQYSQHETYGFHTMPCSLLPMNSFLCNNFSSRMLPSC